MSNSLEVRPLHVLKMQRGEKCLYHFWRSKIGDWNSDRDRDGDVDQSFVPSVAKMSPFSGRWTASSFSDHGRSFFDHKRPQVHQSDARGLSKDDVQSEGEGESINAPTFGHEGV